MSLPADLANRLMPLVREVCDEAGRLAMRYFHSGESTSARIWSKAGGSPVTEADVAVDTFLKIRLSHLLPEAAWLSEETADDPRRVHRDLVWIVDPIDGTRAFLAGNPDWSVAVGLLVEGKPALGIVNAPAHETRYEACRGSGAYRNGLPIAVSRQGALDSASVAGPVPFVDQLARHYPNLRRVPRIPSLALRIARVAEGSVDIGLVSSNARDWDIAAADVILGEAGGALFDPAGAPVGYNRLDPVHGELIASPSQLQHGLVDAIRA